MIEIYREEEQKPQLKTPKIRITKEGMMFVDPDTGRYLTDILTYQFGLFSDCKDALTRKGYRVNFAQWSESGRLMEFIEEIN